MSKKIILVPVDFSLQSETALEFAGAFAKDNNSNSELLIVHVLDPKIQDIEGVEPVEALEGLEAALQDVKPRDSSIAYSHRMLEGPPAETILKTANEENVEMIVMGTHGRTGLKRVVMGSVAEVVVRKAKCPVLTVRQPLERATS